jgi:hypothetical protein
MAQVAEFLLFNHEALNSNTSTTKQIKTKGGVINIILILPRVDTAHYLIGGALLRAEGQREGSQNRYAWCGRQETRRKVERHQK